MSDAPLFKWEPTSATSFVEETFAHIVKANSRRIHDIVDEILARDKLSGGKGFKASSSGATHRGKYWLKDPTMVPTRVELKQANVTSRVTRSYIEPLGERVAKASTVEKLHREAIEECKAAVKAIVDQCKAQKRKFFDEEFYFDRRDIMYPVGTPDDCTVAEPKKAMRLTDLHPDGRLFSNGISSGDITQGNIGDCFFVGAVGALAAFGQDAIERLFAAFDVSFGVYGITLFKNGSWEWVIVDDLIAVQADRNGGHFPLFASAGTGGGVVEYWPIVLEKAYAKIHNSWDTIDGGWAREALVDLTGGLEASYDLYGKHKRMTFKDFRADVLDPNVVLSCSVGEHVESEASAAGRAGEQGALFGLFHGHQYSVIDAKETPDGVGFVHIRNPWGNDAEWKGPYCDNDVKWRENPEHKAFIQPSFANDGCFWMRWIDFRKYFTDVDVVRKFPQDWLAFTLPFTAEHVCSPDNTFVIRVFENSAKFTLVYSQEDPKLLPDHKLQKNAPYAPLRLEVKQYDRLPANVEELSSVQSRVIETVTGRDRAIFSSRELAPGVYIVQSTIQTKTAKGAGVFLRLFAPPSTVVSVFRWGEGEASAMGTGDHRRRAAEEPLPQAISLAGSPADLLASAATLRTSDFGASRPAVTVASVADPRVAELEQRVQELERLLETAKQQAEKASAEASRATAASAAAAAAATAAGAAAQAVRAPKPPSALTPLARLGMDKKRFRDVVKQVYTELAPQGAMDLATAVNGLRLVVTLGAGMDEACVKACEDVCGVDTMMDLATFSQICEASVSRWQVLQP